jgi:hypothetical protein
MRQKEGVLEDCKDGLKNIKIKTYKTIVVLVGGISIKQEPV